VYKVENRTAKRITASGSFKKVTVRLRELTLATIAKTNQNEITGSPIAL
jgi:hypothetical protein